MTASDPEHIADIALADAAATSRLAQRIAPLLRPGDTLLLAGPLGAGKSHFARGVIGCRMATAGATEEIPSPTYTLVQSYMVGGVEFLHADLYRLSGHGDVAELGLEERLADAICLIEWPDRLPEGTVPDPLHVALAIDGDGRRMRLRGGPDWSARLHGLLADA